MKDVAFSHRIYRAIAYADENRSFAAFFAVFFVVVLGDIIFNTLLFEPYLQLISSISGIDPSNLAEIDLGFVPEVWQALLGVVLGTLILVISIASQSIPKLIDLYMKDLVSLFYVWFLIIAGIHALVIKIYAEMGWVRESSRMFNSHILFSLSSIIAFPYIYYILRYTKPSNIINRIYRNNMDRIQSLLSPRNTILMQVPSIVQQHQYFIFENLNQLDDILEFVNFKELKADIIHDMSRTIQEYMAIKDGIAPEFFTISPKARADISFKTMIGQYGEMEKTRSFYEQKCFRLLGNIYINLLEKGEFDLSSMVVGEMAEMGLAVIKKGDDDLIEIIIIRFNTLLRFAIKHGIRNNEPRNLYNLMFHYGRFITYLMEHNKDAQLKKCFFYMRLYGIELFKHGSNAATMYFIVDVVATEMKKILERLYNDKWDYDYQAALLGELLQVDNPPDFNKDELSKGILINNGVRILQIGLALFYQRNGEEEFVQRIVNDIIDDVGVLGEATFYNVVTITSNRLRFSGPTFWEDTDRGNLNIYYTPDQAQIDTFNQRLYDKAKEVLILEAIKVYKLSEAEATLLWEMSRLGITKELKAVTDNAIEFEKNLLLLEDITQERLDCIMAIREKLRFTSDNPKLEIFSSRQIAAGTKISARVKTEQGCKKIVMRLKLNVLNFMYVTLLQKEMGEDSKEKKESVVFEFEPPRHRATYQFTSALEVVDADKKLFRIPHTGFVKIIAQR